MKKLVIFFLSFFISISVFSQSDKIHLHNGKTIDGNIVRVIDQSVIFKYLNEDAEQTLGKYAIEKIVYGKSGRIENITKKVIVNSKDDWENVIILSDPTAIVGLERANEIKGKTSFINYRTAAGSDKKAEEKLKKEAAEKACPFVLLTSEKDAGLQAGSSMQFGGTQSMKKGVAYKY